MSGHDKYSKYPSMSTKFVEENRPGASKNTISGLLSICKGILAGNVSEDLTQKVINTVHWQADTKSKFESTLLQLVRKYHLCQYWRKTLPKSSSKNLTITPEACPRLVTGYGNVQWCVRFAAGRYSVQSCFVPHWLQPWNGCARNRKSAQIHGPIGRQVANLLIARSLLGFAFLGGWGPIIFNLARL